MRIALLSYRSKTHCGGQGVYVRHLSHGLVELGHDVEVFSGQPYPELLDPRVRLTKVPSLDLYREPDPFRVPRPERDSRLDRPVGTADRVDGGLSGTTDVHDACRPVAGRPRRRFRRRPRQPEPGHRTADDRRRGPAGGGHRAPPHHPRPGARYRRRAMVAKTVGAPMVWVFHDARSRSRTRSRTC